MHGVELRNRSHDERAMMIACSLFTALFKDVAIDVLDIIVHIPLLLAGKLYFIRDFHASVCLDQQHSETNLSYNHSSRVKESYAM